MDKKFKQPTGGDGQNFIFRTGIEDSYPTIVGRDGGSKRVDRMSESIAN